jgi:predicted permease
MDKASGARVVVVLGEVDDVVASGRVVGVVEATTDVVVLPGTPETSVPLVEGVVEVVHPATTRPAKRTRTRMGSTYRWQSGTRTTGPIPTYPPPMLQVLVDVLVPVFAIVGIGYLVARRVGVQPPALATLSYWILGPAFIFDVLAGAELDPAVVWRVVGSTVLTMAAVGLLAALVMKAIGRSFSELAAAVLTSIYGNVGNFGLAISAFALGDSVLPIAGIVLVTVNTVGILTGVGLASIRHQSATRSIVTALFSPLALAVIPALFVNLTDTSLPLWLDRPVALLAAALIPVMLLTLGVQIAGMPRALPRALVSVPIGIKLAVTPLIAAGAAALLGLDGVPGDVVVLQAAMPAAVFTSLIALEHDLEPDFVTSVVLSGTLVSVLTLPVVISLL